MGDVHSDSIFTAEREEYTEHKVKSGAEGVFVDSDEIVSFLQSVVDELKAVRDRIIAADDWLQEEKQTGDPNAIQTAEQELAAAMFESSEKREKYRELLELIRRKSE